MPLHIFICPLNWGLGHASRMIPLVDSLLGSGCRVTVGASGKPLLMLQQEFDDRVDYVEFPGVSVRYAAGSSMVWAIGRILPALIWNFRREKRLTKKYSQMLKPDVIISDNRYGVRTKDVFSVFVGHQLKILLPPGWRWLTGIVNGLNRQLINNFDLCLVPDYEKEPGLAGSLSHRVKMTNLKYIGPLSRFGRMRDKDLSMPSEALPDNFLLILLSGPEPQRTLLENLLKVQLEQQPCVWLRGLPENNTRPRQIGNHWVFDHASTPTIAWLIRNSRLIISRSGYSTIMDLSVFGKRAVFIPTPGQTEQEYLAQQLEDQGYIISLPQNQLHRLSESIHKAMQLPGLPIGETEKQNDLGKWLQQLFTTG